MPEPAPVAAASVSTEPTAAETDALISSKPFVLLLLLGAFVGIVVSLAAWGFLEGMFELQQALFVRIPDSLGYHHDNPPLWYLLPVLGLAGVIVAYAVARLPGRGGHTPVKGLQAGAPAQPIELPGILLRRDRLDRARARARPPRRR